MFQGNLHVNTANAGGIMFQIELLKWFDLQKRSMPWRNTYRPYHIWLSEVMLQQTQVATVIPYFERFIEKYPSLEALANGNEAEVLKLWEGLGYYSRARRLIPCAQQVISEHGGQFPKDYKKLLSLPGIGPYTAGAILSIAYNIKQPAVDGNVKRVFSRLYNLSDPVNEPKAHGVFEMLVKEVLPEDVRNFNQALMELGALICKPSSPLCHACPIERYCQAKELGTQQQLPVYKKKAEKKLRHWCVVLIEHQGSLLVEFRSEETLLGQMWGLPALEVSKDGYKVKAIQSYLTSYGVEASDLLYLGEVKHVFTHQVWKMGVFYEQVKKKQSLKKGEWHLIEELDRLTIATAFRKVLKKLEER